MSERYSTDDLIEQIDAYVDVDYRDVIISRLQAADKLCEAASGAGYFIENFGGHRHLSEHPIECSHCHLLSKLRKAIAEYEGKK